MPSIQKLRVTIQQESKARTLFMGLDLDEWVGGLDAVTVTSAACATCRWCTSAQNKNIQWNTARKPYEIPPSVKMGTAATSADKAKLPEKGV